MRRIVAWSCILALIASAAAADNAPAPSPPSKWALTSDEFYTILLANLSSSDLTYIYRICQSDGPATRVAMSVVSGQPVVIAPGACVDIATQGSVQLTRADVGSANGSSGTYQFIAAVAARSAPPRNS